MKEALKTAFPTVLGVVLAWLAIEGIKYARAKWEAEQQSKRLKAQAAAARITQQQADGE